MLHEETVVPETLDLIKRLSADKMLQDFALVGGTALALQLGHRRSVDIDLFGSKDFDSDMVAKHLQGTYKAEIFAVEKNGVFGWINDIKSTLISHQYPMISPLLSSDGVRMPSIDDLGAMKMHAIVNSGQREKDFVDMYYLLEHRSLNDLTEAYSLKYPDRNATLARNAILYHKDITRDPHLELLLRPINWKEIEARMAKAVIRPEDVFRKSTAPEKKIDERGQSIEKSQKRKGKRL